MYLSRDAASNSNVVSFRLNMFIHDFDEESFLGYYFLFTLLGKSSTYAPNFNFK